MMYPFKPFYLDERKMDLSVIKMALEYAQFSDYRIRDGINEIIKAVEADHADVGFDLSPPTKKIIGDVESLITELETERAPKAEFIPHPLDERETEGVTERTPDLEETGAVRRRKVVNVDNEVDEYVQTIVKVEPKL